MTPTSKQIVHRGVAGDRPLFDVVESQLINGGNSLPFDWSYNVGWDAAGDMSKISKFKTVDGRCSAVGLRFQTTASGVTGYKSNNVSTRLANNITVPFEAVVTSGQLTISVFDGATSLTGADTTRVLGVGTHSGVLRMLKGSIPNVGVSVSGAAVCDVWVGQSGDTTATIAATGAIPIGSVLAFIKEPLPVGYLALRGGKFDKLTYPDLFALLGTDDLPNFTDRTPKMTGTDLGLLEKQGWCWPTHSHTFGGTGSGTASGSTSTDGAHTHGMRVGYTDLDSGNVGGGRAQHSTLDTNSAGAHAHTFSANVSVTVSGTTSQAGNSDRVEVDRIGVIYAIKAAGILANEGMAQLDGVLGRVGDLEVYDSTVASTLSHLETSKQGLVRGLNVQGIGITNFKTAEDWNKTRTGEHYFAIIPEISWGDYLCITRIGARNISNGATYIAISYSDSNYAWLGAAPSGGIPVWTRIGTDRPPVVETLWTGTHGSTGSITLSSKLRDGDMIGLYHNDGNYLAWTTVAKVVQAHHCVKFGQGGFTNFHIGDDYQTLHSFAFASGYPIHNVHRIRYNR